MTIPLTNKQLEERRKNLKLFREEVGMSDESTLHTTLLMQEEWLATIDAYKELLKLYEKTLQFYANPKNWEDDSWGVCSILQGYMGRGKNRGGYSNPTHPASIALTKKLKGFDD